MKLKALTLGVMATVAGAVNAAPVSQGTALNTGNNPGGLLLSVFDTVTQKTFFMNLGKNVQDARAPGFSLSVNLAADANWSGFAADAAAGNVQYNIVGASALALDFSNGVAPTIDWGFISTNTSAAGWDTNFGLVSATLQNIQIYEGLANGFLKTTNSGVALKGDPAQWDINFGGSLNGAPSVLSTTALAPGQTGKLFFVSNDFTNGILNTLPAVSMTTAGVLTIGGSGGTTTTSTTTTAQATSTTTNQGTTTTAQGTSTTTTQATSTTVNSTTTTTLPPNAPDLTVLPSPLDFGAVKLGKTATLTMVLRNDGVTPLQLGNISAPDAPFVRTGANCSGKTLARGKTCKLTYRFKPTDPGDVSSESIIASNDPDEGSFTLLLTGTGGDSIDPPQIDSAEPAELGLGGEITLIGQGFGTQKGKVMIGSKKGFIVAWSDSVVVASLPPMPAGSYDVKLLAKGRSPISAPTQVTLLAPSVASLSSASGTPNDKLTITGAHFGKKKPKVFFVSGNTRLAAKVLPGYSDNTLAVLAPKKLKGGQYQVVVRNAAGESSEELTFEVK